jgi:hypothetical protein
VPFVSGLTAARCRFHIDIGAPQAGQKVESAAIDLLQRGHANTGLAWGAAAGGVSVGVGAVRFGPDRVFMYPRKKKNVTTKATTNVNSVSMEQVSQK